MSRVFTATNAAGATVHDVDTLEKLPMVLSVDADAGVVRCAHQPLRTVGDEIDTFEVRYRAIHPIYAGSRTPVMFHCYGRLK